MTSTRKLHNMGEKAKTYIFFAKPMVFVFSLFCLCYENQIKTFINIYNYIITHFSLISSWYKKENTMCKEMQWKKTQCSNKSCTQQIDMLK
jgi:hypothetical protein